MAEKFYVIKKVPCPGCGGDKIYTRFEYSGVSGKNVPVEYDCQVCRGTGTVDQQVPLQQALKELGVKND